MLAPLHYVKSGCATPAHLWKVHPGHRAGAQRVGEHIQQHRAERQPARQLLRDCAAPQPDHGLVPAPQAMHLRGHVPERRRGQPHGRGIADGLQQRGTATRQPRLRNDSDEAWMARLAAGRRPRARPGRRPWRRGLVGNRCGGQGPRLEYARGRARAARPAAGLRPQARPGFYGRSRVRAGSGRRAWQQVGARQRGQADGHGSVAGQQQRAAAGAVDERGREQRARDVDAAHHDAAHHRRGQARPGEHLGAARASSLSAGKLAVYWQREG